MEKLESNETSLSFEDFCRFRRRYGYVLREEVILMDWSEILNAVCAIIWGVVFICSLHMQYNGVKVDAVYLTLAALICMLHFLRSV